MSRKSKDRRRGATAAADEPAAERRAAEPAAPVDPQIPIFELLPAFEEERPARLDPDPVTRVTLDEASEPGEHLRLLATRVSALGRDKRLRRIGVVGSEAGEGASTVALGLASALSRDRKLRVLLLELDLRRPSLDERLGLRPPAVGVRQYLAGSSEIPVVRLARPQGFWLLSAGSEAGVMGRDLSSPRLAPLLRAADRVFDYVVADCHPLLAGGGGGGASLQGALDGFVLVVHSRRAARETIRRAAYTLRPEQLVGLVLNAQRDLLFRGRPAHQR